MVTFSDFGTVDDGITFGTFRAASAPVSASQLPMMGPVPSGLRLCRPRRQAADRHHAGLQLLCRPDAVRRSTKPGRRLLNCRDDSRRNRHHAGPLRKRQRGPHGPDRRRDDVDLRLRPFRRRRPTAISRSFRAACSTSWTTCCCWPEPPSACLANNASHRSRRKSSGRCAHASLPLVRVRGRRVRRLAGTGRNLARVVHSGRLRDFFGFNRAKHAVVEAAILATRIHLLPRDEILAEFARLKTPVEKTAGPQEIEAFALLERYVRQSP